MFGPNIHPPPVVSPDKNGRQFKPGIVSFVLGLVTIALFFAGIILFVNAAFLMDPRNIFSDRDSLINLSVPTGIILCCAPTLSLAGIGFGIMAVIRKADKMIFGIIGLIINSLFIIVFCLFTAIGIIFG